MSIVEYKGGPITHRYLMKKSKDELASMALKWLYDAEYLAKAHLKHCNGHIIEDDGISRDCELCKVARKYQN